MAVLDLHGPAALWSGDRSRSVFNGAAAVLLGLDQVEYCAAGDWWLQRVHSQDRHRVMSAWRSLQDGPATMVCSYRFLPPGGAPTIELRETARCLSGGLPVEPVVLSHFESVARRGKRDCGEVMRNLIHQIGNNLQSIRSEADLLRLFGGLPQESFETIVRGIETIHRLTEQLGTMDIAEPERDDYRQPRARANAARENACTDEV